MIDVKSVLSANAKTTENILEEYLAPEKIGSGPLQDAMRYSTLGGGKRIRACLALEFCKAFSGKSDSARAYAAAIEMVHAYSLIHDDLPCMDDDDMRRGKPSCHIAFGEATALLAGDTLLTYAMEVAAGAEGVPDKSARLATSVIARCAGSLGMAGGQEIDLSNSISTYDELKKLHSMKTSALIKGACLAGYYSSLTGDAECGVISAIGKYAESVGLAFQIKDDLLDLEGDEMSLGKRVGIDGVNGRINSLTFMSPEEAARECDRLANDADEALSDFENCEFLRALPHYLNSRTN